MRKTGEKHLMKPLTQGKISSAKVLFLEIHFIRKIAAILSVFDQWIFQLAGFSLSPSYSSLKINNRNYIS